MNAEARAREAAQYDCGTGRHRWVTALGERRYTCGECGLDAVAAIAEEREACAVVAENESGDLVGPAKETGDVIAAAIRARR